ncbi:MAG: hypothetical protein JNK10_08805 [Cyclobacteriaceae bacterium]|nr:hypothetical protein [Cyclobacteriaceae bacterium]
MKEASQVKFYFAKYFFLAFGLLQWLCGVLLFLQSDLDRTKGAALLFFTLGLLAITCYILIAPRLKRVALGKSRVTVFSNGQAVHYEWPEVKWIRAVPFVSVYKLKLRGKKNRIYFLPEEQEEPVYGIYSEKPALSGALKKRLK